MITFDSQIPKSKLAKLKSDGQIRFVIWIYFWLILLEGVLRKWFLPSFSTPLLIIRDPVVIYAYWLAWEQGIFPRGPWMSVFWALAFISAAVGLLAPMLTLEGLGPVSVIRTVIIVAFGLRTNFLHLPLVFLMGRVLRPPDVIQFGRWIMIAAVGVAILMVMQFSVAPDHFLNIGVGGGEDGQISGALGKIRPPGPFAFITGPAQFFPIVTAFLSFGFLTPNVYNNALLIGTTLALGTGVVVSISRGLLAAVVLVIVSGMAMVFVFQPRLLPRVNRVIAIMATIGIIVFFVDTLHLLGPESFLDQGLLAFQSRIESAARSEGGGVGFVARALSGFDPFRRVSRVPLLGYGLGLGTNAGAAIVSGGRTFLLGAEGEWDRIIAEMGPIIGLWFIGFRVALTGWLGWLSFQQVRRGSTMAWLLFTAVALPLMNGQFGPPTQLGLTVFGAGLCLAACRISSHLTNNEDLADRKLSS